MFKYPPLSVWLVGTFGQGAKKISKQKNNFFAFYFSQVLESKNSLFGRLFLLFIFIIIYALERGHPTSIGKGLKKKEEGRIRKKEIEKKMKLKKMKKKNKIL